MQTRRSRFALAAIFTLTIVSSAAARVVSYAPYSDRVSFPAVQRRTNRYFALVEGPPQSQGGILLPPIVAGYPFGQLVIYDSSGAEEPRIAFPQDGTLAGFAIVGAREDEQRNLSILILTSSTLNGQNPQKQFVFMLSTDSGATWKHVLMPSGFPSAWPFNTDFGGPFTHSNGAQIRIGTSVYPFVVNLGTSIGMYAISTDAIGHVLAQPSSARLIGSDASGGRMLVQNGAGVSIVNIDTGTAAAGATPVFAEGWITPTGNVYLSEGGLGVSILSSSVRTSLFPSDPSFTYFAIPTADYVGAWIIERGTGKPTSLYLHTTARGLEKQWTDVTGPEVEALHTGASGTSLLIQVHRSRPQADQRLFKDPALAVWHVGEPAPTAYDELFMNEQASKGFVHLDVDKVASGDPFVFDSGPLVSGPGGIIISPFPGGGSDVTQEWGVVRASLKQRLVLPGIAHTPGGYGSFWLSDITVYNPLSSFQNVKVRYVATGDGPQTADVKEKTLTLGPQELRVIPDALKTLFAIETGGGAFFFTPDVGVNVTSRTYTQAANGTYGFNMNGIDVFAAARPRFPVSFSGAFQGTDFRTNLVVTDVSGRGTTAGLVAAGTSGVMGYDDVAFPVPVNGQQQFNLLSQSLGILGSDTGALLFTPVRGEAIASVIAIDSRTNDATYFPPDLPATTVRTIPAIGHLDGANNSKFRTDLFLYNPTASTKSVTLQAKAWDTPENPVTINLTLLGNEARVIRDVLKTAFGKTGFARLRYQGSGSTTDTNGVRVTARTYSIDDKTGGTYGFLMPPFNNFQSAGPGDSLEIVGVVGDPRFRTNLGLVELTGFANGSSVAVKIDIINDKGLTIDTFTTNVAVAGGIQLNDIFHMRNLGDGPPASILRISPANGMIGAYAVQVDNGTNDPSYLAAQLAAKN